jgi:hypothetical protein
VLLEATTSFLGAEKQSVSEDSEQATYVEFDEANLYCMYSNTIASLREVATIEHDVRFVVVENGPLQTLATFLDNGVVRPAGDI